MRDDPSSPAKPKLADVARAAEVSVATASNVFAHPERVRPAMRERVEAAARALGYLGPDPTARLMRAGKVNAIGVIPPGNWGVHDTLRNPVYQQFLLGVAQACDEAGVNLLVSSDLHRPGAASAVVDGFIFARVEHMGDIEPARLRRLPFVVLDSDPGPEVNSVRVDARGGCRRRSPAPARARPPPLRGDVVPARLRPAAVPPAGPIAPRRRRRHGDRSGETPRLRRRAGRGRHRHRRRADGAGPPLGARRRAADPRRRPGGDGDPVDVGDAGDRGDGRGAPARPHRAARPVGGRLQRHPRGRPRQPAAHHRRRHEHREGPRRRQAACWKRARSGARSCRRGSSCAAPPRRRRADPPGKRQAGTRPSGSSWPERPASISAIGLGRRHRAR